MIREEWEALCKRCGRCCYRLVKEQDGRTRRHKFLHCEYLKDNHCSIYKNRFEINQRCSELFELMLPQCLNGFLPEECGYIKYYKEKHDNT